MTQTLTRPSSTVFSQIRITLMDRDTLRGLVTVKIGDAMFLTGIRLIEGKNGLFVSMPSRKTTTGEYQDICFPASKDIRDELSHAILEAYKAQKNGAVAA